MLTPVEGTLLVTVDCKLVFLPRSLPVLEGEDAGETAAVEALRPFPLEVLVNLQGGDSDGAVIVMVGVGMTADVGGTGVQSGEASVRLSDMDKEGMR